MGTELVVIPGTGEAIALNAPTPAIARLLDDVRDLEQQLRSAKRTLSDEIHRRMDQSRTWTLPAGDFKLTGESDAPKMEWDGEQLDKLVQGLLADGTITQEAADAAVEATVAYKVKHRGVEALRKNPKLRARVDECGHEVPVEERQRRVSVKRVAA